ncbi:MAG: NifB/NifX family molybdenum-iron cluster-binding protein [Acidobacteriota bacterium]|nr:NifB/NifX family molybdenum-iron cluster-binding protein [Acidobacteriota bacterium]
MILAFPTLGNAGLDEDLSPHFGRGDTFTLYNMDSGEVEAIANTSRHRGGQGEAPELLAQHGVKALICVDLGRRAVSLFCDLGIKVYSGAAGKVKDALEQYKQGRLRETSPDDACTQGKHFHD